MDDGGDGPDDGDEGGERRGERESGGEVEMEQRRDGPFGGTREYKRAGKRRWGVLGRGLAVCAETRRGEKWGLGFCWWEFHSGVSVQFLTIHADLGHSLLSYRSISIHRFGTPRAASSPPIAVVCLPCTTTADPEPGRVVTAADHQCTSVHTERDVPDVAEAQIRLSSSARPSEVSMNGSYRLMVVVAFRPPCRVLTTTEMGRSWPFLLSLQVSVAARIEIGGGSSRTSTRGPSPRPQSGASSASCRRAS